jgi:hypothetical protein
MIICAYCSWEMALNVGLDVSLDNTQDWKGIRVKAGEADSTSAHVYRLPTEFSVAVSK